jgi:glycerol-3-phosphate dehydrogenase (NAD(P)+)
MRIAILGAGAWGTALAAVMAQQHQVTLYARDPGQADRLRRERENRRYLPGIGLPAGLRIESDLSCALEDSSLVVMATPISGLRQSCSAIAHHGVSALVWLCKGLEEETNLFPHAVVHQVLPDVLGAVLSGPSFALEVAQGQPTALTVAASEPALQEQVVEAFHGGALRVYKTSDVVGVEVGGAVKNVLALACGISDGLGLGQNARAALVTRGLSEMVRLGVALGGRPETLMGLTGMGDLILTCTGALSRNRQIGLALGRGESLGQALSALGHVAEGVRCARSVEALSKELAVDMPITAAVCAVLFDGVPAREMVAVLLARSPRAE